jgi:trigger factor
MFSITLKELKERELPDLDDEFAKEASGEEFETLAALHESLEKRFNDEAEQQTKANKEEAILTALLEQVEAELPETMIEREVEFMVTQTAYQLQSQGIDINQLINKDTISILKDRSRPEAVERIKRTLALGEVAKRESLKVEEAEINQRAQDVLEELEGRDIDMNRLRSAVEEDLLKEKIMDWLTEHSTFELVPEGTLKKEEPEAEADDAIEAEASEVSEAE